MQKDTLPRDPAREASDSIRGYIYQFAFVVEALLDDPSAIVYVETFEDLLIARPQGLSLRQVKSREAGLSLTQRAPAEMLDRWAVLAENEPSTTFMLVTTQIPANLHDSSDSFRR